MERDDVALSKESFFRNIFHPQCLHLLAGVRIEPEQSAGREAVQDLGCDSANISRSQDSNRLAVDVKPLQVFDVEVMFSYSIVRLVDFSHQAEQQTNSHLCNRVRTVNRDPPDVEASFGSTFEVHVVESRAPQQNRLDSKIRKRVDHSLVCNVVHKQADNLAPVRELYCLFAQTDWKAFQVFCAYVSGERWDKTLPIVMSKTEDCNLWHGCKRV
mmetsp:Transcript_31719/g.71333  ORF Transcript_31719/g.71333 Transcript_31719/m.71333 type:complete len:214 (-) Transcript_31719:17-658(-)